MNQITLLFKDADGFVTRRSYQVKDGVTLTQGQINAFCAAVQKVTKLSVIGGTYFHEVTYTPSIEPVPGCRTTITASLTCRKTNRRPHTFNLPDPLTALRIGKTLKISATPYKNFIESFDDGTGAADVQGDYFVSDGEQIITGKIISGKMNRYNHKLP